MPEPICFSPSKLISFLFLFLSKIPKGPFGAHDMIEIGYDMKLDKDRK